MRPKPQQLLLAAILVIASFLRLYQPGQNEFWTDQAATLATATNLAHDGQMVWLGNPSAWEQFAGHSPFSIYFTALPLFFFDEPLVANIWYALFGILTVLVTYFAVRRYFDEQAALCAAALMAVSPLAVYWGRFAWNPNIAPLFIIFWWWTAALGYIEHKRWGQILHWVSLSLIIQAQTALFVLTLPSLGLVAIYILRQQNKRQVLINVAIGASLSIVLALPWVYGLYGQSQGWVPTPFGVSDSKSTSMGIALPSVERIIINIGEMATSHQAMKGVLGDFDTEWWTGSYVTHFLDVHGWFVVLTLVGLAVWGARKPKEKQATIHFFTVAAMLTPLIYLVLPPSAVSNFYLQPITYLGAIAVGIMIAFIWQHNRLVAGVIAALLITTQLWLSLMRHDWLVNISPDVKTTLTEVEDALQRWAAPTDDILFLADGGDISPLIVREWSLIWNTYDQQYPIRVIDPTQLQGIPIATNGSVLVGFEESGILPTLYGDGTVEQLSASAYFRSVLVTPADLPTPEFVPIGDDQFGELLRVDGITLEDIGAGQVRALVRWQPLTDNRQQYQFSLRVLDAEGSRLAQADGPTLQPNAWRVSDTVLTYLLLNQPEVERAGWRIELLVYSLPDVENMPLSDGSGVSMFLTAD